MTKAQTTEKPSEIHTVLFGKAHRAHRSRIAGRWVLECSGRTVRDALPLDGVDLSGKTAVACAHCFPSGHAHTIVAYWAQALQTYVTIPEED